MIKVLKKYINYIEGNYHSDFIEEDIKNIKVGDIDLVVSRHTNGGQVRVPFKGGYVGNQGQLPKYDKGLFDLNKIKILITSGMGSGKQKVSRFNNQPEIVNLQFISKTKQEELWGK